MADTTGNRVGQDYGSSRMGVVKPQLRADDATQEPWMQLVSSRYPSSQSNAEAQASKSYRILIVDDHELMRVGVRAMLESHQGWTICGEAGDGREAVAKAAELKPDLVVLDVAMPILNGVDAARQILKARPGTAILILTGYESEQMIRQVLEVGARGFLLKSDAAQNLLVAVEALQRRAIFFNARAGQMMLDGYLHRGIAPGDSARDRLTSREREVVQLLAEGYSSKEVAAHLNLCPKTVETHRTNVMRKLGLHSVAALVRYAVRNSIVQAA